MEYILSMNFVAKHSIKFSFANSEPLQGICKELQYKVILLNEHMTKNLSITDKICKF
jgi:hypothetical protein